MKNTLLVLALTLVATFTVQAQDSLSVSTSDFKPIAGDRTIEAGTSFQDLVYGGTLKFRKFTTDEKAFRLSGSLHFSYDTPHDDLTSMYSAISIIPGIERHFAGTSRLSPYIGAELPLTIAFSKYETSNRTISGAWSDGQYNRAFTGVGLNAIAGVDFYIVKNFFIGLEFGAGVSYRKYSDIEIDYKEHDFDDQILEGGSSLYFNTFSNSGFRIGFVF
jgi:outer membrane protein W